MGIINIASSHIMNENANHRQTISILYIQIKEMYADYIKNAFR